MIGVSFRFRTLSSSTSYAVSLFRAGTCPLTQSLVGLDQNLECRSIMRPFTSPRLHGIPERLAISHLEAL